MFGSYIKNIKIKCGPHIKINLPLPVGRKNIWNEKMLAADVHKSCNAHRSETLLLQRVCF